MNFALLRELIDAIETKTIKEVDLAYKVQLAQLKDIYRVDRQLGYKFHFWRVRSMEEMVTLNNPNDSNIEIARRLYTESEEVLQGGFDMLTELEQKRGDQIRRSNLLA